MKRPIAYLLLIVAAALGVSVGAAYAIAWFVGKIIQDLMAAL